jgi:large subunit ribosomal protein L23
MLLKPVTSEKAVKIIELDNTLIFETERRATKPEIKKEVENIFSVKVKSVRTLIQGNVKFAYVKLNKSSPAIDVANKLGVM